MKRLLISSLSLLLLGTAVIPVAQAQSQSGQSSPDSMQQNQMDQESLEDSNQNQRATPYEDGSPASVEIQQDNSSENQQNNSSQDSSQPAANEGNQNTYAATGNFVSQYEPTPFEIVSLARQGYLQNQGIPSYATLTDNYRTRDTTPEDIVQAAVDAGRLPASRVDDAAYTYGVLTQLRGLDRNFRD
ncbi:hypothetical protein H6F95_20715 [Cyanobacteria bacterium FACHB-471]|nr:hypothetical protein [Cyanobacteria bacterium FACHB-471]